jgi:hypothetical protein
MSGHAYEIVDTNQTKYYGDSVATISKPGVNAAFYGQDAQYSGAQPSYNVNGDGTTTDLNTGLMWMTVPVENLTWAEATAGASTDRTAGYADWRLPTIKELYSLMAFSGSVGASAAASTPFIDTTAFTFEYGDTANGERFIDAQYWSSTHYVGTTMKGADTAFGVNFADGRIKGYPTADNSEHYVRYVRGNQNYGENDYVANNNGTISDRATGLMWSQADSGAAMSWEEALAYAENATVGGYSDWRLPNAKELQSIVDYSRAPDATAPAQRGAAIDTLFTSTDIGAAGDPDYGYYWSGTTHVDGPNLAMGVYIAFGEAGGWMQSADGTWSLLNVHGAGSQRSDPKTGDPADYPHGNGPQGDVLRMDNYVRLVRDAGTAPTGGAVDSAYYLSANTDVAAAGIDAATHFSAYGAREGRAPNSLLATLSDAFNESAYLATNADVAAAVANGGFSSGLHHWLSYGFSEGRNGALAGVG